MTARIQLGPLATQSKELWSKLSIAKRIALAAVVATALIGALYLGLRTPDERRAVLFANLTPEDAGAIVEQLNTLKVPHHIEGGGTAISVAEERVHELRLQLASAGLPRGGGVGFELFDKQNLGTTSFVEQLNFQRALQGELSRSIASMDVVERARVHLALPERSIYTRRDEAPSASVVLRLRSGRALAPQQVRGIVHLVASSIPRLTPNAVTVVDEAGTVLWSGDDALSSHDTQRDLERTLTQRVTEITERIVGAGHAVVVVTAELDAAQTERTEERFGREGVLRSEARTEESAKGTTGVGGLAGVSGNLPEAVPPAEQNPRDDRRMRLAQTRNFEVDRVLEKRVSPRVQIKRLHVAIMVDGIPVTRTASTSSLALSQGELRQRPRAATELDHIAALAKEAAGLDPTRGDRIEVRSVPFFDAGTQAAPGEVEHGPWAWATEDQRALSIAAAIALVLLVGVALLLAGRRRRRHAIPEPPLPALPVRVAEAETALSAALPGMPAPPPAPRELAMRAARENTQRAAEVVAAWLAESPVSVLNSEGR